MMDKAKAYDEALERARKMLDKILNNELIGFPDQIREIFPQLSESESEDERIRKALIDLVSTVGEYYLPKLEVRNKMFAYLEKQKENIEKEYVFRPLAGTDITIAAEQAIRRADEGDRLVLAFNGAYIPVRKGCNANKIVDIYDTFIEKQKERSPLTKEEEYTLHCIIEYLEDETCPSEWVGLLQDIYNLPYEKQKEQESIPNTYGCLNCTKLEECEKGLTPCSGHRLKIVDQKPADDKAFEEWIDSWFKEHKEKAYPQITMDEKEFKNFCRGIRNMYQQKSDWNEEDKRMFSRCIKSIECSKKFADSETYKAAKDVEINWLKDIYLSLKKHNEAVEKLWSNDWSEEDKKNIAHIIRILDDCYAFGRHDLSKIEHENLVNKLKSLCPSQKSSEEPEYYQYFDPDC